MADSAKDAASKQRIIKHMNDDHADSLAVYTQHFCKLSQSASKGAKLADIDLDGMTLSASGKEHRIPFSPPMKSYAEARARSVELDREARNGLGISSTKITTYLPPSSAVHIIVFGLCGFTLFSFVFYKLIVPGTTFYDVFLSFFPGGPETFKSIVRKIALPVTLIHVGESLLLERTRLRKYNVQRGSAVWWKWMASCMVEGFGTFQRIDVEVKRKELEAANAKH